MAEELAGDFYEAVTELALDRATLPKVLRNSVRHRDSKPNGFQKDLDFWWESPTGEIVGILMVTHTGSLKDWSRKFWRNVGEVLEAKCIATQSCGVFSCLFEATAKEALERIALEVVDGRLDVTAGQFPRICAEARKAHKLFRLKDTFETKLGRVQMIPGLQGEIAELARKLGRLLSASTAQHDVLVREMRRVRARNFAACVRPSNSTYVRKAFGRLLCCSNDLVEKIVEHYHVQNYRYDVDVEVGRAVEVLITGIITRLAPSVQSALRVVGTRGVRACIDQTDASVRQRFRAEVIQHLICLQRQLEAFSTARKHLSTPKFFADQLELDFRSGGGALGIDPKGLPWLFGFSLDFAKAFHNKKNDFGYGWLSREKAASSNIRFWAPQYVAGKQPIPKDELVQLAKFLSQQVSLWSASQTKWEHACDSILEFRRHNILVNKIDCHVVDPLEIALSSWASCSGIPLEKTRIGTVFGELAKEQEAGFLYGFRHGKTVIMCRSVSEGGRDHRVRELSGFIRSTLINLHDGQLRKNTDIAQRVLVVDGDYRQSDFEYLFRSGFDAFVSLETIDDLKHLLEP